MTTTVTPRPATAGRRPTARIAAAVSALTLTVLGVGVGTAAPASAAQPLHNGSQFWVVKDGGYVGRCTATVIDRKRFYTAGHCGSVGATAEFHGDTIATATRSGLRQGYDILEFTLKPLVRTSPTAADLAYRPTVGDPVSKDGSVSGHTEGTVKTAELSPNEASESVHAALDGETFPVSTWEANLLSARGDSGSPVSHNGKVVGILTGGHGTETTTVTPLREALDALRP